MSAASIQQILSLSLLEQCDAHDILQFEQLCDHLITMTEEETHILLNEPKDLDEDRAYQKIKMLQYFEEETARIVVLLQNKASTNTALMTAVLQHIHTLQDKLQINTAMHFETMKRHALFDTEGHHTCH